MQEFYLADEKHKSIKGDIVELKGLLYFRQSKSGYDGKATKDQVSQYPGEYESFRKANPDYVLPDSLKELAIGAPEVTPQPEKVVAPVVAEKPLHTHVVDGGDHGKHKVK